MAIEFQCPRCESTIRVPDSASGTAGNCPKCKARLKVPAVVAPPPRTTSQADVARPPATPVASAPAATFEFGCPLCAAPVLVPRSAAGRNGKCPHCGGRIHVPHPADSLPHQPAPIDVANPFGALSAGAPAADSGGPSFESFQTGQAASPNLVLGSPASGIAVAGLGDLESEPEERGSRQKSRRKSVSPVIVMIPVACLALLIGGGAAYFLLFKPSTVQGDLTAEVLRGDELAPVLVDKTFADLTDSRPLSEALAKQPLQFNSPTVGMEVSAQDTQLKVSVRTGVESVFYRVALDGDSRVEKYLQKNRAVFEKQRAEDLFEDGQKFVTELQKLIRTPEKGSQGMEKYRNTVGLASLVKGLGYHVVARYRGELFRCVYEDSEGRLYFLMPKGVTQFQIIGRSELPTRHQPFSGTFQVKVKSTPVDLPPLPPAPKAKKENDAPAKKKAEKTDEPAPRSEEEPPGMIDQIKPVKKKVQLKDG